MTPETVLEVMHQALITTLKVALPMLMCSLIVGVAVSIIQALTQIQETTLTFVPKMIALFLVLAFAMPFIGSTLGGFTHELFTYIVQRPG